MRSRRRKEESVKKDGEIKVKWRVGGAVCLFSFKREKNSQEAAKKKVGKEDSVVKTAFVRRSTTLKKSQMSLLIFMNVHFIPLTPAVNAKIHASNLIGTLFNGVRVPATNINFRSHKKRMWNKAVSQDLPLFILQQTTKCQPWFALVSGSCVKQSLSGKSCKSGRSRHVQVKHRTFSCSWL